MEVEIFVAMGSLKVRARFWDLGMEVQCKTRNWELVIGKGGNEIEWLGFQLVSSHCYYCSLRKGSRIIASGQVSYARTLGTSFYQIGDKCT